MTITDLYRDSVDAIAQLFAATFADSEGAQEGRLIGDLARRLLTEVEPADLRVFSALEDGAVVGSVIFSRLHYPQDERTVFLLSPLAVATSHQGRGVGQALLRHAFHTLREEGVESVITYGDVNFYSRVDFQQIEADQAEPPLALSYPHGWLGQSLDGDTFVSLKGPSQCVAQFNDPSLW
jgi:predicted N-acetyltransferase YhbS